MIIKRFFLYILILCCGHSFAQQCERITLFDADLRVHKDASMQVIEQVNVRSCGQEIRHGIIREIPTTYTDRSGNTFHVRFTLNQVLLDGEPVAHKVEKRVNGVAIYMGNARKRLQPGAYTYTIAYTIKRHLGFFEKHDELYWNVTGQGWRLPIDEVKARVRLPEGIDLSKIEYDAYTGYQGQVGSAFNAYVARNGAIKFETTRPLRSYQGLTIVVGWPKGHLTYPTWFEQWVWFFQDNLHWFIFGATVLFLLLLFILMWYANRKKLYAQPIIPLFAPPEDMTPGMLRYVMNNAYDATCFATEVVNMAVNGMLKIVHVPGDAWYQGSYRLEKKDEYDKDQVPSLYNSLGKRLFGSSKTRGIRGGYNVYVAKASLFLQGRYATLDRYFKEHKGLIFFARLIAALSFVAIIYFSTFAPMAILVSSIYLGLLAWGGRLIKTYNDQGLRLKREIEGFKLFLTTTEQERLKVIGTPPTKTPELYETYLPYAIALGVEKQWSQQFAPLFERMQQQGVSYVPVWYVGPGLHRMGSAGFVSNLTSGFAQNFSSVISSSTQPPGSSSGFGGRSGGGGRAGGGAGGGGGGGW